MSTDVLSATRGIEYDPFSFALPPSRYARLSAHRRVKEIFNKSIPLEEKIELAQKATGFKKQFSIIESLVNPDLSEDLRPLLDSSMVLIQHRPVIIIDLDGTEHHGINLLNTSAL